MSQKKEGCSGEVFRGYLAQNHKCSRRGVMFEEGEWWCKQHAPSKTQERRKQSSDRYKEKIACDLLYSRTAAINTVAWLLAKGGHSDLAEEVKTKAKAILGETLPWPLS